MAVKLTVLVTVLIFGMYFNKIALCQWSECSTSCGHGTRTRYYPFFSTEECNNGCYNGGVMRNTHCDCPAGTTGPCCHSTTAHCASNPCQHGGTCIEMINSYSCSCTSGYYGPNCENDFPDCASNPCQHGGTCIEMSNSYSCSCTSGYYGPNCENDIPECTSNPCQHGGTCIEMSNRYSCSCTSGYYGPNCENDIIKCANNPCQHGGTCFDMINRYECNCTRRYTGPNCENDLMWEHYSACQQEFKRCFRIFQQPLVWTGAQDFCTRRAGHLAVLDTTEKQYFLETSLKTLEIDEISSHFWIGASSNANALYWITGDAVVNTRWSPGVGTGNHGYGCLTLSTQYSFMWTELNCSSFAYFICEEGVDPIESILG